MSPTTSYKSNPSSLDLDGFILEAIVEEEEGKKVPASPGFTALLTNPILMDSGSSQPQPRTSSEPESTRSMTRPVSTGQAADPQEENRKLLMDLKENPDVLPDGSK